MLLKRTWKDLIRYWGYILFAAKSDLRSEVAGSYLSWLWWILDPVFFMLVYTFVVRFVFRFGGEDFPVFVFIGLSAWQFFSSTVMKSVNMIRSFRAIISKVYVPKYVFILVTMIRNLVKMAISFGLIFIMMLIFRINFSWTIFYIVPITVILFLFTFAVSIIVAHIGVFITDFANILNVILRLMFYLSGVLYSIPDQIPPPFNQLMLLGNPIALLIEEYRNVLMYQTHPSFTYLIIWIVISILIAMIGLKVVYKYENTYVKVV
jgi:ABC-type polysaccharide/polyol phosphate export permease